MSVVATPSTALLVVAVVGVTKTLVSSILAALVAGLVTTKTCKATILAAALATVKSVLLLEVVWVTTVTLLRCLWWWKSTLTWSTAGSRPWTRSLGQGWAWAVGGLRLAKRLQVIGGTRLSTLLSVMLVLSLIRRVAAEGIVHAAKSSTTNGLWSLR